RARSLSLLLSAVSLPQPRVSAVPYTALFRSGRLLFPRGLVGVKPLDGLPQRLHVPQSARSVALGLLDVPLRRDPLDLDPAAGLLGLLQRARQGHGLLFQSG